MLSFRVDLTVLVWKFCSTRIKIILFPHFDQIGIVDAVYNIYSIIQAGQQLQPMKSVQIVTEADKILELCIMENPVYNTSLQTHEHSTIHLISLSFKDDSESNKVALTLSSMMIIIKSDQAIIWRWYNDSTDLERER